MFYYFVNCNSIAYRYISLPKQQKLLILLCFCSSACHQIDFAVTLSTDAALHSSILWSNHWKPSFEINNFFFFYSIRCLYSMQIVLTKFIVRLMKKISLAWAIAIDKVSKWKTICNARNESQNLINTQTSNCKWQ